MSFRLNRSDFKAISGINCISRLRSSFWQNGKNCVFGFSNFAISHFRFCNFGFSILARSSSGAELHMSQIFFNRTEIRRVAWSRAAAHSDLLRDRSHAVDGASSTLRTRFEKAVTHNASFAASYSLRPPPTPCTALIATLPSRDQSCNSETAIGLWQVCL
jgi:hypothetical protein